MKFSRSLVRITTIAEKEWVQIRRDFRSLVIALFAPAILIMMFGYALSLDVKNVGMAVWDQDRSALSRRIIEEFSHTEYIRIKTFVEDYASIDGLIDRGKISMALVIPRGFEKRQKAAKQTDLQLLLDGSDSTSTMVALGYVRAIVALFNAENRREELGTIGIRELSTPVDVRPRVWYNPELKSKNFIIPGVIVLVLSIISALIASLTISREWERGTMETLITTPLRGYELVLGKLLPYLLIGLFDVLFAVVMGYFVFGVPFRGNIYELYLVSLLFLVGTTSMGIMISSATRVQVISVQASMVATYLPSFILSGFVFPIQNMPVVVQGITYLVPARYLVALIKGIMLKGVGVSLLWAQVVFLAIFALLMITISIRKLKMRLPES